MNVHHCFLHREKAFFAQNHIIFGKLHLSWRTKTKDTPLRSLLPNFYFYEATSSENAHSSISFEIFQSH